MRFINIFLLILFVASNVVAKNLTNRLGIGYNAQIFSDTPAVSAKYALSEDFATSAYLGFRAGGDDNSNFAIGGKVYRNAYQENYINFYLGGGVGMSSLEINNDNDTGLDLMAFIGSEFFLDNLPNLGFTIETGVSLTSRGTGVTFKTTGDSFVTGGIHYYF